MLLRSCTSPRKTSFQKGHFPEKHLTKWTLYQMYISLNIHFPKCTFGRMDISPKTYFPELTLARMYIWPNGHFPENLFSRTDTCQNVHLMLAIIIQEHEIQLFCSVSRVNICFVSGLLLPPCAVHLCIVLRVPLWKKICQYYWIEPWISLTYYQYLNSKILHGGTLLQPWPNAFGMRKYFSKDYVIPSQKLNEHQKKGLRRKLKWFFAKIRWRIRSFSSDHAVLNSRWGDT